MFSKIRDTSNEEEKVIRYYSFKNKHVKETKRTIYTVHKFWILKDKKMKEKKRQMIDTVKTVRKDLGSEKKDSEEKNEITQSKTSGNYSPPRAYFIQEVMKK